jgi:hypothetical protein
MQMVCANGFGLMHGGRAAGEQLTPLSSPDIFGGRVCPEVLGPWVGVYVSSGQAWLLEGDGASVALLQSADWTTKWTEGSRRSFWLSFDRCNQTVKYGMGHYREETTLLSTTLSPTGEARLCAADCTLAAWGCRLVWLIARWPPGDVD